MESVCVQYLRNIIVGLYQKSHSFAALTCSTSGDVKLKQTQTARNLAKQSQTNSRRRGI